MSINVTPAGKLPDSLRLAVGTAVVVTVNVPAAPAVNVVLLALVMLGARRTLSCPAVGPLAAKLPCAA